MVEVGKIGDKTLVLDGCYISIFKEGKLVWKRAYMGYYLPDGNLYWYRRRVRITELSGNTLKYYQIRIEIGAGDPIWKHARSAGEDIRFCYHPEEEMLSYWIEKYDPDAEEAIIWVKVPEIPANSEIEIYMYYGNPTVASESDGDAVFEFFDDFESGTLDKWTLDGTGQVVTSEAAYSGNYGVKLNPTTDTSYSKVYRSWTSLPIVFEGNWKPVSRDSQIGFESQNLFFRVTADGTEIECIDLEGNPQGTGVAKEYGTWYKVKIKVWSGGVEYYVNDMKTPTNSYSGDVSGVTDIFLRASTGTVHEAHFDNIFLRKYASVEPSVSVGAEE